MHFRVYIIGAQRFDFNKKENAIFGGDDVNAKREWR
jgi:hypothetical protein